MRFSYLLHPLDRFWVVVDRHRAGAIVSVHASENGAAAAALALEGEWRRKTFDTEHAAVEAA